MATLRSVLGKFNGTMADVTFSNWKGQNVAKQKVPDTNGSASPAQVAQRTKFAALAVLSGAAGPVIRIGMKMAAVTSTEQNVFQSLNAGLVSIDNNGNAVIDWPSLIFSTGKVPALDQMNFQYDNATKVVHMTWPSNANGIDSLNTDKLIVLAVSPQFGGAVYNLGTAERGDQALNLDTSSLPHIAGGSIRIYYFMKRANTTECSVTYSSPI